MHSDLEKMARLLGEYDGSNDDYHIARAILDDVLRERQVPDDVKERFEVIRALREQIGGLSESNVFEDGGFPMDEPTDDRSASDFLEDIAENPELMGRYFGRLYQESSKEFDKVLALYDDPEVKKRILKAVGTHVFLADFPKNDASLSQDDYEYLLETNPVLMEGREAVLRGVTLRLLDRKCAELDHLEIERAVFDELVNRGKLTFAAYLVEDVEPATLQALDESTRHSLAIELCRASQHNYIHPLEAVDKAGRLWFHKIDRCKSLRGKLRILLTK